ncbi:MAG: hypothetical protein QOE82_3384, partial [Thermoanaerobaculia bacterium]|nr:hypothetical protein [Thermoanaerobaculia bacterium]
MPPAAGERFPASPAGVALGANLIEPNRCEFRVWAPDVETIELHIVGVG